MNAHLPAHLDAMKAPPQRDAVHAAFLRASQDGKTLTQESEWRRFLGELTSLKVCSSSKERRVLEETAEEIRQVAKEARAVIEEAYDGETLDAFSEALAPAFKNSLSPDFYKPPAPEAGD